jgi:hypothetical protein
MSFLLLLISTLQRNWIKAQNRFSLETWKRGGREGEGGGGGQGAGGKKDPNNVCTYE